MPKINRIRITNFTYINRHIVDETFNFYDGENALLSLANGGGKSVLVQTIFQPIVPKVKLLERNFANFFAGKKGPAYIIIEWLLDNDAGYLLTGIAMSASESYSASQEDESLNLNYYTFTNQYEKANSFDLKSIPVTEKNLNGIIVCGYNDFRKKIQAQESGKKYDIRYYGNSKPDQIEYERLLNTYSISRNEWKELMVNINENEHGVSGVFKDCKNSRQVMEQWIIRYIEKVLDKSSRGDTSDHQKLEIMMNQVATSEVENENIISQYNEIDRIISDFNEIKRQAVETSVCIEQVEKSKKNLANMHFALTSQMDEIKAESNAAQDLINRRNEDLRLLDIEETSEKIYLIEDKIAALNEELNTGKIKLENQNDEKVKNTRELSLQKGAVEYSRLKEKEINKSSLRQKLDNLEKGEKELIDEMNKVKYSLKNLYKKQKESLKNERETKIKKTDTLKLKKENTELDIRKTHEEINTLSADKGKLENKTSAFLDYEKKTFEEAGILIYRNPLVGELDSKSVEDAKIMFANELKEIEAEISRNEEKIAAAQNEIRELELKEQKDMKLKEETNKELFKIEASVNDYETKKQKVEAIIRKYCNGRFNIFEREEISRVLSEQHLDWNSRYLNLDAKINELSKIINGINENTSFIPASLVSVMEQENIEVYTGESYLKGLPIEEREKIIARNPLLAYGILATEKEISKIKELLKQTNLNQIVPLFRHNEKEKSLDDINDIFLASPQLLYRDKENLVAYINGIENDRENLEQLKREAQNTVKEYYDALKELENFEFTGEDEKALYEKNEKAKKEIQELEETIKNIKIKSKLLFGNIDSLKRSGDELKSQKQTNLQLTAKFEEYLKRDSEYVKAYLELQQTGTKINEAKRLLANFEELNKKTDEDLANERREISLLEHSLMQADKNLSLFADAKEAEVMENSEQELLGKLRAYEAKSSDISNLQTLIVETETDIKERIARIENSGIMLSDLENVYYSESRVSELEEKLKSLEKEIQKTNADILKTEKEISGEEGRLGMLKEKVPDENRFERFNIKGNFKERKNKIHIEKDKLNDEIKKITEKVLILTRLTEKIAGKVDNIKSIQADKNFRIEDMKSSTSLETLVNSKIEEYVISIKKQESQFRVFERESSNKKGLYSDCEFDVVIKAAQITFEQIDKMQRTYEGFYFLIVNIENSIKILLEMKSGMQIKVDMIEHHKRDFIEQANFEALRIYNELPKITENSGIEIDGTRRKILEIKYDKIESDEAAREKISLYINDCLENIIQSIKSGDDENKIRKNIAKLLATKELLNAISNLENVKVRSYKIDINESNSKMKDWEEIKIENSGGEKFFAYFSLLVALISYSRKNSKNADLLKAREDSKVLIMDNPFGPITSGHLLKPMFDIARKYNTQLICLSDIKEGAVLNSFNLVYLIKIRKNMTRQEFLEIEERSREDLKINEKLEDAFLYMKENQIGLF